MARAKKTQLKKIVNPEKKGEQRAASLAGNYFFLLSLILLVSFIVFLPVWQNGFVNFDDGKYILDNPMLHSINPGKIFSSFVEGNYHPLTMLIYAVEYQFFGLNAGGYHAVSLLLHLLNIILVFFVILSLSGRREVALVAALLFGIHPLHVESVAWASELKDLLYTFFFLASWLIYLKYLKKRNRAFYFYCLLLFLLSLFSKAMAVTLPVVFLLTDYFMGRKLTAGAWLEKLPFFILSAIFGVIAIIAQKSGGAIEEVNVFPFFQRLVFASYGFITYLFKLFAPHHLSAYYAYPVTSGAGIPGWYYFYPFIILLVGGLTIYSLRYTRVIFFGLAFFLITVLLVLQILPVGGAIMADRYTYIPSIGIFYLAGTGFHRLWAGKKSTTGWKFFSMVLLIGVAIFFSIIAYKRCMVWENGMRLWSDVISKEKTIPLAYVNRGTLWQEQNKYREALEDYNKAIELQPKFAIAYYNRAILQANLNNRSEAIKDYSRTIELKPDYADAYNNRSVLYRDDNRMEEAMSDCNRAISLQTNLAEAFSNRGILFAMAGKFPEARRDFDKAIELNPGYARAYGNRGLLLMKENKYGEGLVNYNKAIELEPGYADAYYNRGILYQSIQKSSEALKDFTKVIELQPGYTMAYYYRATALYNSGNKVAACGDLQKAVSLGYQPAADLYKLWCQ